jgi:hypothetical protein
MQLRDCMSGSLVDNPDRCVPDAVDLTSYFTVTQGVRTNTISNLPENKELTVSQYVKNSTWRLTTIRGAVRGLTLCIITFPLFSTSLDDTIEEQTIHTKVILLLGQPFPAVSLQ